MRQSSPRQMRGERSFRAPGGGRAAARLPSSSGMEPTETSRFAPPDLGVAATIARLARVGREQWRLSALGLGLALLYTLLSLAIPLLIARAIDRSIVHHEEPLGPLLAAILALAVV